MSATAPDVTPAPRPCHPVRALPFTLAHVACLGVFVVGWSPFAVGAAATLDVLRAFGVTASYHRGPSHRAFDTGRTVQSRWRVDVTHAGLRLLRRLRLARDLHPVPAHLWLGPGRPVD